MSVARRRFRFIKEIAEGGFGKVYLAEQLSADGFSRIVAVKLLHAKWSSHDEVVMRTRDEARLLGLIRHQNIVKVEDLTSIDGKCAIVMEYLEGVDLKWMAQYLKDHNQHFPRGALFETMLLVASALDAAYNGLPLQGGEPLRVIHRDIKPSNIFVTVAGQVKVLDFGTARANFAEREAKTQALAFGSQGYMAPERMLGEEDTPAADVFSLGVTLWELLALDSFGRIPPRPNKFAQKVDERIHVLPLEGEPDWQDQVREVLRLMLSYEPRERPSAAQLVDIFEMLATDAGDMGLRRFCRTLVAEAKANEPDLDTGDPLTGQVVDEDVSSAFGMGAGGLHPLQHPDPSTSDALGQRVVSPQTSGPQSLSPYDSQSSGPGLVAGPTPTPASLPPQQVPIGPRSVPPHTSGPITDAGAGGGGGAMIAAVVAVGLVVLLLGGGAAAIAAYFVYNSSETHETSTEAQVTPAPTPEPPPPVGCNIVTHDARHDGKGTPTVVTLAAGSSARDVTITGGIGFKAVWDGKGDCDLGKLPEGRYRANITKADGDKIRGSSFGVVDGKSSCRFAFDVATRKWSGECK